MKKRERTLYSWLNKIKARNKLPSGYINQRILYLFKKYENYSKMDKDLRIKIAKKNV
jgi:hypothetical protein